MYQIALVALWLIGLVYALGILGAAVLGSWNPAKKERKVQKIDDFRVFSLDYAGTVYRAMNGDKAAQQTVTIQDVAGLQNAPTFEKFLLWNKDRLDVVEMSR